MGFFLKISSLENFTGKGKSGNMKIAFFNSTKSWGGGEKWHFEISAALAGSGWDTVVFTNNKSELYNRLANAGMRVYKVRITNLSFLNPVKILQLTALFKHENIEAIVLNLSADLKAAGLAAKLAGIRKIIYRRGSAIPIKNSLLNRIIFKKIVTGIIANSRETKETILKNNPKLFPADKIEIIYNGLDLKKYESEDIIRTFRENGNKFVVGNLGRLVKQKGQHYLVDLAAILKERHLPVKLIIGGTGPLKENLVQQAKEKKVEDMVVFAGFISDVKGFMMSLDAFVLTSLWEGFGYVIAEALYFKKPVIAFDVSSNPELIENEKDGFLVKLGDINTIADKIEYLYKNSKILTQLGENGYKKIKEEFTFDQTLANFISFISSPDEQG